MICGKLIFYKNLIYTGRCDLAVKNIVFDMGNVLINYDPNYVLDFHSDNEEDKKEVYSKLFDSYAWVHTDLGILSDEEILNKALKGIKSESAKKLCRECFCDWQEHNLIRKPDMERLCMKLKESGMKLYILSNAAKVCREALKNSLSCYDEFSGMLFSAEVKCIKPQSFIYEKFFDMFGLSPDECLFIDDLPENIRAGEELGMRGYVFDGDSERLEKFLYENIIPCDNMESKRR